MVGTNGGDDDVLGVLTGIWTEVLALKSISPRDDFFKCGGDSLIGTIITMKVEQKLGAKLELVELFEWPILEDYARIVRSQIEEDRVRSAKA